MKARMLLRRFTEAHRQGSAIGRRRLAWPWPSQFAYKQLQVSDVYSPIMPLSTPPFDAAEPQGDLPPCAFYPLSLSF